MKLEMYQVDAFSSELFAGNPAAVCPLPYWLDDKVIQAIAFENNLSETAFLVGSGASYEIRWFTPTTEVALCGHATLASGYVVSTFLCTSADKWCFSSESGQLMVFRKENRLCLDFPSRLGETIACPTILSDALGIEPSETFLAADHMVVLESEAAIRALAPDFDLISQLDSSGLIATAPGTDCDFVSRCFFPQLGVPEDPVTGSAHCTLAPYWAKRLGKESLHCRQISKRGGELWCETKGERVEISGHCALYLRGEIFIST